MNTLDEDSKEHVEPAKQKDKDINIRYDSCKDVNVPSPCPSPSTSRPLHALATET